MEYQNFITVVKEEVEKRTGENYKVRVNDIMKNNGVILNGLTVMGEHCNISPTIYLNGFYEAYESGVMTLGGVVDEVMETYERNKVAKSVDMNHFMTYENIRDKVIYKLVHAERNRVLLEDVPHIKVHDLAVVFQCLMAQEDMGNATVLIHNAHLKLWGIDEKKLYQAAIVNTPRLLPYEISAMKDVIRQLLELDEELPVEEGNIPMYVLSNRARIFGAACILYPDVLRNFADEIESDLYILPSSVHELILLPTSAGSDIAELTKMVQDINETQLGQEEVLSDSIYYYSRDEGKLLMLSEEKQM
ncbi:MAG: hypothetical protein E7290_07465 [Lachnospiraceae bacterium]|nr:hypothetical protein [Lachnospiraceae bacterium]